MMVMQVSSPPLQNTLDCWEHMYRFGINVPRYFLVHDNTSLRDLFAEWVPQYDIERLKMFQFDRQDCDVYKNLPTNIKTLTTDITDEHVKDYYYLAMPYIEEGDFVLCGYVKGPQPEEFEIEFGYREDHRIPYEDTDEVKIIKTDYRGQIAHPSQYFGDVKRIVTGFPYSGVRMTWSVTTSRIGRNNSHLCFWDYQVDESLIRS
jgi:hypothetical protein